MKGSQWFSVLNTYIAYLFWRIWKKNSWKLDKTTFVHVSWIKQYVFLCSLLKQKGRKGSRQDFELTISTFCLQDLLQILWGCTSWHTHYEYLKGRTSSAATLQSAVRSYSAALLQKKGSRHDQRQRYSTTEYFPCSQTENNASQHRKWIWKKVTQKRNTLKKKNKRISGHTELPKMTTRSKIQ